MEVLGHWLLDGQDKLVRLVMVRALDLKSVRSSLSSSPVNSDHLLEFFTLIPKQLLARVQIGNWLSSCQLRFNLALPSEPGRCDFHLRQLRRSLPIIELACTTTAEAATHPKIESWHRIPLSPEIDGCQ